MITPIGIATSRIVPTITAAVERDHGPDALIIRMSMNHLGLYANYEIGGVTWVYDLAGTLIDAHLWKPGERGANGRRIEIDKRTLATRPVEIAFDMVDTDDFFDPAVETMGGLYEGCRSRAGAAYRVTTADGPIGTVVQVRYDASEVTYQPTRQWLAMTPDGNVWSSYGRTREEAARHLLSDDARMPEQVRLAA